MPDPEPTPGLEPDSRFPSGKWVGYYLMPHTGAARHPTELLLSFRAGRMTGEGRDKVGKFVIEGQYDIADGRCHWQKKYIGQHTVHYQGYNEGKGIWGVWEIPNNLGVAWKAGFHIWPEALGDPSQPALTEHADVPAEKEDPVLIPV